MEFLESIIASKIYIIASISIILIVIALLFIFESNKETKKKILRILFVIPLLIILSYFSSSRKSGKKQKEEAKEDLDELTERVKKELKELKKKTKESSLSAEEIGRINTSIKDRIESFKKSNNIDKQEIEKMEEEFSKKIESSGFTKKKRKPSNLNIILLLVLCLGSCFLPSASDSIVIRFNEDEYIAPMPNNLEEARRTIENMELLISNFNDLYLNLKHMYQSNKKSTDSLLGDIMLYTDTITHLTQKIDSLNSEIDKNVDSTTEYVEKKTDSIKTKIDDIETKPLFNFGIGFGIGSMYFDDENLTDYTLMPMIVVNNIYGGLQIGVYDRDRKYNGRYGINFGVLLK